jgi:hypothetical protein
MLYGTQGQELFEPELRFKELMPSRRIRKPNGPSKLARVPKPSLSISTDAKTRAVFRQIMREIGTKGNKVGKRSLGRSPPRPYTKRRCWPWRSSAAPASQPSRLVPERACGWK